MDFLGCNVTESDTSDQRVTVQRNPTLDLGTRTVRVCGRRLGALLQGGLLNAQEPDRAKAGIAAGLQWALQYCSGLAGGAVL